MYERASECKMQFLLQVRQKDGDDGVEDNIWCDTGEIREEPGVLRSKHSRKISEQTTPRRSGQSAWIGHSPETLTELDIKKPCSLRTRRDRFVV